MLFDSENWSKMPKSENLSTWFCHRSHLFSGSPWIAFWFGPHVAKLAAQNRSKSEDCLGVFWDRCQKSWARIGKHRDRMLWIGLKSWVLSTFRQFLVSIFGDRWAFFGFDGKTPRQCDRKRSKFRDCLGAFLERSRKKWAETEKHRDRMHQIGLKNWTASLFYQFLLLFFGDRQVFSAHFGQAKMQI